MINITLRSRDRYKLLTQTLESLYAHTPREEFTLTLVDDRSSDFRTLRLIERYEDQPNFASLRLNVNRDSSIKNLGVKASEEIWRRGEWLYLTDNDVFFLPGWSEKLTTLARETEGENFKLWGGQVHPFHHAVKKLDKFNEYQMLDGLSHLMRWETWDKIGPYRGVPDVYSEDVCFCKNVTRRKGRIGVPIPPVVLHCGLTTTEGKDVTGRGELEKLKVEGVLYL